MNFGRSNAFGTRIIESEHALVPPKDAISDDMREMVEDLRRFGEIRLKPGAFSLNGTMYVHPTIYASLSERLARDARSLRDRMAMEAIYGGRR